MHSIQKRREIEDQAFKLEHCACIKNWNEVNFCLQKYLWLFGGRKNCKYVNIINIWYANIFYNELKFE